MRDFPNGRFYVEAINVLMLQVLASKRQNLPDFLLYYFLQRIASPSESGARQAINMFSPL
jgi:hypothetical protein